MPGAGLDSGDHQGRGHITLLHRQGHGRGINDPLVDAPVTQVPRDVPVLVDDVGHRRIGRHPVRVVAGEVIRRQHPGALLWTDRGLPWITVQID